MPDEPIQTVLSREGSRVLLVGCGRHVATSRLPDVPAVPDTISDLEQAVRVASGLDPARLSILVDPQNPNQFGSALLEAAAQASDALLFYYVGHGLIGPDQQLYLATQETVDLARGIPGQQAFAYSAALPVIEQSNARLAIVILDCCFAGRAYGGSSGTGYEVFEATRRHGTYVLAATGYDQRAWAPVGERHTAFTGELIRLLEEGDPTGPPWLTLDNIYHALDRRLLNRGRPRPRRQATDTSDVQVVAVNRAYETPGAPRLPGLVPAGSADSSPYRGLERYGPQHARFFFGRRRMTAELTDRLASWDERLIMVTGPSGSGKSSLINAGLVPAVEEGKAGRRFRECLLLTPGPDPAERLSDHLEAAQQARAVDFVLIIDQFEELFTQRIPEARRREFLQTLASTVKVRPVLLGVRADFFGHCARYPELVGALEHPAVVGPMSRAELTEAIEGPARVAGLALQEGLSELLMRDLGAGDIGASEGAGALPFLSHALLATWQHREGDTLTLNSYAATGGIYQAVAQTADSIVRSLSAEAGDIIRWLLTRMVRIGDGTDDTRRNVPISELLPQPGGATSATIRTVLDAFIAARLITAVDGMVTITHEALIRAWPQLRSWIDQDRAGLLVRQQLTDAAAAWVREGRDPSALYRGSRLAAARQWAAAPGHHDDIDEQAREFLEDSVAQETAAAQTAQRRRRQLRVLAAVLCSLLIIAAATAGAAYQQNRAAAKSARVAQAGQLINLADALRASQPRTSLVLGVAAMATDPSGDARASLLTTLTQSQYLGTLTGHHDAVNSVAFSPAGGLVASGSADRSVILWSTRTRRPITRFEPTGQPVYSVAFNSAGTLLAVATTVIADPTTVTLWDVTNPARPRLTTRLSIGNSLFDPIVEFSPTAPVLVTTSGDLTATLWNVSDPRHPYQTGAVTSATGPVYSLALRPDGRQLAVGSDDSTTTLWGITPQGAAFRQGQVVYANAPGTAMLAVGYSPDGQTLATASGSVVRLWNVANPESPTTSTTFTDHSAQVQALAFSSQGALVTVGQDDIAYDYTPSLSDPGTYQSVALRGDSGVMDAVAFSPDGAMLATASTDDTIDLWRTYSLAEPQPYAASSADRGYKSAAYSPDGKILVAAGADSTLETWSVAHTVPVQVGSFIVPTNNNNPSNIATIGESGVSSVAFSPDGPILATSSYESTDGFGGLAMLWRITAPGYLTHLSTMGGDIAFYSVAISPDGKILAAGGAIAAPPGTRGAVALFDISDPAHPRRLDVFNVPLLGVQSLAFRPTGDILAVAGQAGDAAQSPTGSLWDVATPTSPRLLATLPTTGDFAYDTTFNRDGDMVAISTNDGIATLWNVTNPAHPVQAGILAGNTGAVESVTFSPDSRTVMTAGDDKTAILWDITDPSNPVQIATLTWNTAPVYAVFNPGGTLVATASLDGSVAWWNITAITAIERNPVADACALLGPHIDRDEWSPYVGDAIGNSLCRP